MSLQPLVSICIRTHNSARFVEETLKSALSQTYKNIEIIVSDDASTDSTIDIINKYTSLGVKLFLHSTKIGAAKNGNFVVAQSKGKYFVNLDSDDLIAPYYVETLLEKMENYPNIGFAHCACRLIDENGKVIGIERSIHGSFVRKGLEEWKRYVFGPRAMSIVMVRRESFDKASDEFGGFDERCKYSYDWALYRKLLKVSDVLYCDKVLASYRCHNIGKEKRYLAEVEDYLFHLEDMEKNWPKEVPDKDLWLKKARKHFAISAIGRAAFASEDERNQIITLLPLFKTNSIFVSLLSYILKLNGAPFIVYYKKLKEKIRQKIKSYLYKREVK